jgi:hypothetical protein
MNVNFVSGGAYALLVQHIALWDAANLFTAFQ